MKTQVLAPSVGESITEVSILKWGKQEGEAVKVGELLLEIESDKATVEVVAEVAGALHILKQAGEKVLIGTVLAEIDDAVSGRAAASPGTQKPSASATASVTASAPTPTAPKTDLPLSPAVRKIVTESGADPSQIKGTGKDGRLTKGDVIDFSTATPARTSAAHTSPAPARPAARAGDRRVPMTRMRAKIAERLVAAQHTAAILTTFNEVDMGTLIELRNRHKDGWKAKHGLPMSFMSFFIRATVETLKQIPAVNASIDGADVVYHDYYDIGFAVGTERGLVVPVLRDCGSKSFLDIEREMMALIDKARAGKLSIPDMTGGTFTISNGGVYGSLLSTPILNPPQSGILGMHKTQDRPMAVDGKIVIRPMMYLAHSYDHRMIDGKEAVTFLVTLRDFLEHPEKLNLALT